jgi:predicted AlkP superfamily pyrophosphatase or phosphodiesterase
MRNDYIYRYWQRFGDGGFKRLITKGYYFKNTHYNYIPTFTGPGHCSIYTGATPNTHGIIANDWHLKNSQKNIYCVEDTAVLPVGTANKQHRVSPKNQLSSTIGDELKINSNNNSKVFAVAIKDRSALLPAGHAANGAFWFDDETGNFVSSTWYMNQLPQWLQQFNAEKNAAKYLQNDWKTLYPISTYSNSLPDENNYESVPNKKEKPIFDYNYKPQLEKNNVAIIKATPFGNSITTDVALACIKNENMGKDNYPDLFCLSYSSPDIIAHAYGPRSVEIEDVYLRLDKEIERLLNFLEKEIGKNNYTVFLTADHGAADVPRHLSDNKINAGYSREKKLAKELKKFLFQTFSDSLLLEDISNEQIFLNEKKIKELNLDEDKIETQLCKFLVEQSNIAEAYPSKILKLSSCNQNNYLSLLQNGYSHKLSGNVAFMYQPAFMDYGEKGTTHGSGYNYDTHVPLIFFGAGIKAGNNFDYTSITQIAPTICELLKLNQPNGCISKPLNGYFVSH